MGLPLSFKSKKPASTIYITLLLSDSSLQASLWQVVKGDIQTLSKSSIHPYGDQEQVVVQADKALQELGKQSEEVNDVVFGLPHTWVDEKGVAPAKKPLLKKLTEDLSLKAVGFVEISEALSKHLTAENPRLSILLVELSQHELYLSLINQGELISTKFVGRSGDTMADMTEALARLNAHQEEEITFPSKMMIASFDLDEEELKDQQQTLLSHDWVNSHPFTHPPTVEFLDKEKIMESVIRQGGGSDSNSVVPAPKIKKESQPVVNETPVASSADSDNLAVEVDPNKTQASSYGIPMNLGVDKSKNKSEIESEDKVNLPHSEKFEQESPSKMTMKFKNWFKEHRSFAIVGFFAGVLALVAITGVWLNTGVKAVVELSLVTQAISKETTITLDSKPGSTDVENLVLAANLEEKKVSGKKTKETTGVKVVGDKASGKVTIYNKTESEKTFEAGTKLSKGDLVFTINEEVKVSSASTKESGNTKTTEYGETEVEVTALEIGADHNLEKETEFQVGSFDPGTYAAQAVDAFTGGSSREVRVVSVGDQDQLIEDLRKKLLEEAQQDIEEGLEEGEYIAAANIEQVNLSVLDAEIGDEIGTVTLDLEVVVQAMIYKTEDLKPLAEKVLESDIPEGYTLANSEPQIMSAPDQEASESSEVSLVVNITSEAKPDLDLDDLKQALVGKEIQEAEQSLAAKEVIDSVKIKLVPGIAAQLYPRLPKDPAKIEIQ